LRPGLCPGLCWGAYNAPHSPDSLAGFGEEKNAWKGGRNGWRGEGKVRGWNRREREMK